MKPNWVMTYLLCGALLVCGVAFAQSSANTGYVCYSVSVNSSSTPVGVLPVNPPYKPTTWTVKERAITAGSASAVGVLIFPYVGTTVPTSAPSACASPSTTLTNTGCIEVQAGTAVSDAVGCDQPSCVGPMGQAWAAVLESGSTAVDVDSCIR